MHKDMQVKDTPPQGHTPKMGWCVREPRLPGLAYLSPSLVKQIPQLTLLWFFQSSPFLFGYFLKRFYFVLQCVCVCVLSHLVMPDSLQSHGMQHTSLPCPSLSRGVCSNSCPLKSASLQTHHSGCPFFPEGCPRHLLRTHHFICIILFWREGLSTGKYRSPDLPWPPTPPLLLGLLGWQP